MTNLFVLAYGYFCAFSLIYLGLPFVAGLLRRAPVDALGRYAIVTLIYIFTHGIVANITEGPVATFMMSSAFMALALRAAISEPTADRPAVALRTTVARF